MNHELPTIVAALGGNAISPPGEEGNIDQQFHHTRQSVVQLARLAGAGHPLAVTHGNGPQVGNVIRRVELAAREIYSLPLHVCVADTQAGMGYMISQCLANEFRHQGVDRPTGALVTMVEVDANDPGFQHPTKPIGRHYTPEEATRLRAELGWPMIEAPGRGWRRVIASPRPVAIVELPLIANLVRSGTVLVAAGGGGVPVVRNSVGDLNGVDAVIDKDLTSALLAVGLGARHLVILTGVEHVALDYGKPTQRPLSRATRTEAARYLADGQFPEGSMGPKIMAAIEFLAQSRDPEATAIITDLEHLLDALEGKTGTWVTRD